MISNEAYLQEKRDLLVSKMDAKQLPHEFRTSFGSKEAAVEELRRNRDEQ